MPRSLRILAAAAIAGVTVAAIGAGSALAATPLTGTVGPGFTITLKKGTAAVKTLKAGTYTLTVQDKSNFHNFHLRGPGLNKTTSVTKLGRSVFTVVLKKGKTYTFVCDPHLTTMKGSFKVV